jgi:hypothetical protein
MLASHGGRAGRQALKNLLEVADRDSVVTQTQEHTDVPLLTAHDVSARVGEILGAAEREAREIIAAARGEDDSETRPPALNTTIDDVARALERLSLRFDAFELATAAQIEELGRAVHAAAASVEAPPSALAYEPDTAAAAPLPEREATPGLAAARVRAIDMALAGYTRDSIANELAVSIERGEVDALLDRVLIA